MKKKLKVKMPLIVISGIFILLTIFVNYPVVTLGDSSDGKLEECLTSLAKDNYSVYGTVSIRGKNEDVFILQDMSLLYKGIVRNSDNEMKLDVTLSVDNLEENRDIGSIYKVDDRVYFQFPTIQNNYFLDIGKDDKIQNMSFEKIMQIFNNVDDGKIIKSKGSISTNDKHMKIMVNKISVIIDKDDIVSSMRNIADNEDDELVDKMNEIIMDDFSITSNSYIDNKGYLRKEEIILQNNNIELLLTCYIDKHNKVNHIQMDDLSDNYTDIKDIKENEVVRLISNMLFGE